MVDKWCDDYVRDHDGAKPTYTLAQIGSGVAPMTFQKPWDAWKAAYDTRLSTAPSAPATPLDIVMPSIIVDAWSSAVAAIEATKLKELEADKIMVRRELSQIILEKADQATEMAAILADGEAAQEEFEQERADAVAALATAITTIAERGIVLVGVQDELLQTQSAIAAQGVELKAAKATAEKQEKSLEQAMANERVAHAKCQQTLGEMAEVKIANTHLSNSVTAANAARTASEATLAAKRVKLELTQEILDATRNDLALRTADLSGVVATLAGLREQLAAAETRSEQAQMRSEVAAAAEAKARVQLAALVRELPPPNSGEPDIGNIL